MRLKQVFCGSTRVSGARSKHADKCPHMARNLMAFFACKRACHKRQRGEPHPYPRLTRHRAVARRALPAIGAAEIWAAGERDQQLLQHGRHQNDAAKLAARRGQTCQRVTSPQSQTAPALTRDRAPVNVGEYDALRICSRHSQWRAQQPRPAQYQDSGASASSIRRPQVASTQDADRPRRASSCAQSRRARTTETHDTWRH